MAFAGDVTEPEARRRLDLGLGAFVGDYGLRKVREAREGFGLGLRLPETPPPLTTWSLFSDDGATCFIEGVLYDKCFSHSPVAGEDPRLARNLLANFRRARAGAIEELSGSFSGFVFDRDENALITFVDRLGTRVLYWSTEADAVTVASNLAAFRALKRLALDQRGVFQYMTVDFPIGERTLLEGISIQRPASVNIFRGRTRESRRYWTVPGRRSGVSPNEGGALISHAMEEFVDRMHERTREAMGLGLSGGHDSRVILGALAYRRIPFEPVTRIPEGFNERVARALCAIVGQEPRIVEARHEPAELRKNVFVYSDGQYFDPVNFVGLARACAERQVRYLLLGFGGDVISGDLGTLAPQYLSSIDELARSVLHEQMESMSFDDMASLVVGDERARRSLIENAEQEWRTSFGERERHDQHLWEVGMWQSLANRNLKRVRFSMAPALEYVQLIFPYLDNRVLDTYFTLPMECLAHQKAHCRAGFYRFREFGDYRACPYPISLRNEARFPWLLYRMRLAKRFWSRLSPPDYKGRVSRNLTETCEEVLESSLFDSRTCRELFARGRISPRGVRRLRNLLRFHEFYVRGRLEQ